MALLHSSPTTAESLDHEYQTFLHHPIRQEYNQSLYRANAIPAISLESGTNPCGAMIHNSTPGFILRLSYNCQFAQAVLTH